MGDKPAEKSVVPADLTKGPFLEAVAPHMFMDPQRGTHGFEFGFRWNYENPKGDDPPQQPPQQGGGCCGGHQQQHLGGHHHHHGGFGGGYHPHHIHGGFGGGGHPHHIHGGFGGGGHPHHHHLQGGFGGPRMMMPRPPPRQLGPFNQHAMMAGQGWNHHPPAGRFMAAPPAAMHMHQRFDGWGPHHHQHAANYNYFGGFEYEYDYPTFGGGNFCQF